MIRAVLIDAGGVLFTNVSESSSFLADLAAHYGADERVLRAEIDRRDAEYETGARHVHEVLLDALIAAGMPAGSVWDAGFADRLYRAGVTRHDVAFAGLRRLRDRRPDVIRALANNEAEHWDRLKDGHFGHFGLFDVIGSSWRVGAVKPAPDYFQRVLAACDCAAADALLLDDNPVVVAGALAAGVPARLLSGPEALGPALAAAFDDPGLDPAYDDPGLDSAYDDPGLAAAFDDPGLDSAYDDPEPGSRVR